MKAAGGPVESNVEYRVLAPIESGNLLLFPVVRANGKAGAGSPFLTLDEGFKNGSVEVTEAGKVRGLVRGRDNGPAIVVGDQVNTLVLVNNSSQPLLLLAGEIVTGGKQDRVIAKDRIVPPGGDPIDLSVFCIEPGRWVESSAVFGASSKAPVASIMVQPTVREQAMVAKRSAAGVGLGARNHHGHGGGACAQWRPDAGRPPAAHHQLRQGHAERGTQSQGG